MLREKEEILNRLSKLEGSCRDRDKIVDQIKIDLEEMSEKTNLIMSNNLNTDDKIERLRSDVDKIDRGVKRYIDNRLADIKTQIDKNKILDDKGNLTNPILQNIKEALVKEPPVEPLKEIRSEIESLKVRNKCEEITIASIRDSAIDVKNKLEMSGIENMSHSINNESTGLLSTINSSFHNQKERDLVKDAIDNSAKLIHQIIKIKVSESSELNLIHKCNVDIKKITSYSKSCHDLLMKGGRCIFSSTVPEELSCQGCKPRAEQKGWGTLNILYCCNDSHASTRAPVSEIRKQFEKYLGKLSSDINERNLKNSVNFMQQVYSFYPSPDNPSVLDKRLQKTASTMNQR